MSYIFFICNGHSSWNNYLNFWNSPCFIIWHYICAYIRLGFYFLWINLGRNSMRLTDFLPFCRLKMLGPGKGLLSKAIKNTSCKRNTYHTFWLLVPFTNVHWLRATFMFKFFIRFGLVPMKETKFLLLANVYRVTPVRGAPTPTTSLNHTCEPGMVSPLLWRKPRLRGAWYPAQGHIASLWLLGVGAIHKQSSNTSLKKKNYTRQSPKWKEFLLNYSLAPTIRQIPHGASYSFISFPPLQGRRLFLLFPAEKTDIEGCKYK